MFAGSPYAIPGRNPYLRRRSSLSSGDNALTSVGNRGMAAFAFFLFALRFWRHTRGREAIRDIFRKRTSIMKCVKTILGWKNTDTARDETMTLSMIKAEKTVQPANQAKEETLATSRITENQHQIQRVLKYWFGRYTPDESQKNLWMIANSSIQLRKQVDSEIVQKFGSLLMDLAAPTSSSRSSTSSSEMWFEWCVDEESIYGSQGKIAAIIVLDQFSRHMQRHYDTLRSDDKLCPKIAIPPQTDLDALALETAKLLMEEHCDELKAGMVPLPMLIFALMPYRHASNLESLSFVQGWIEGCAGLSAQLDSMLGRFRKATNRRMAILQDEARRTGESEMKEKIKRSTLQSTQDPSKVNFQDDDILETFPFEADMTQAFSHPVHKTVVDFLTNRGIQPNKDSHSVRLSSPVIVSLSGGVDSMVIASVLSNLNRRCGYNLKIVAVHIDYANRPESGAEADYVCRYCASIGVEFYCRRIAEVTRGVTARDDYERISRELRYHSYREAIASSRKSVDLEKIAENLEIGVMLGHHRGDLRENVLSNAHKGCGPLDLSGMTEVSRNDGVLIYRPLLPLEKSFVIDYAHRFGVPYFKDTTPHWSTRGKLRNKLLPLLEEIYGAGSMKNLSNLAVESDDCRALLHKAMIGPFLSRVERRPMGIIFETSTWKSQSLFFWKFVLREALHSARFGMFSDKSVSSFLERIRAEKLRAGWLQCRRDYAVYLQEDGRVYVLYPSSFPFNQKDTYDVRGEAIDLDEEKQVGPWKVRAVLVDGSGFSPSKRSSCLEQKALPSMDHLMNGKIEYFLSVPTWHVQGEFMPRLPVFIRFTKASRPIAWKNNGRDRNMYLKVQETLPLLGNDNLSVEALEDPLENGCVHESNGLQIVNPTKLLHITLEIER